MRKDIQSLYDAITILNKEISLRTKEVPVPDREDVQAIKDYKEIVGQGRAITWLIEKYGGERNYWKDLFSTLYK